MKQDWRTNVQKNLCQFALYHIGNCINLCQFREGFLLILVVLCGRTRNQCFCFLLMQIQCLQKLKKFQKYHGGMVLKGRRLRLLMYTWCTQITCVEWIWQNIFGQTTLCKWEHTNCGIGYFSFYWIFAQQTCMLCTRTYGKSIQHETIPWGICNSWMKCAKPSFKIEPIKMITVFWSCHIFLAFTFLLIPKCKGSVFSTKNSVSNITPMQLSILMFPQRMLGKKTHSKTMRSFGESISYLKLYFVMAILFP